MVSGLLQPSTFPSLARLVDLARALLIPQYPPPAACGGGGTFFSRATPSSFPVRQATQNGKQQQHQQQLQLLCTHASPAVPLNGRRPKFLLKVASQDLHHTNEHGTLSIDWCSLDLRHSTSCCIHTSMYILLLCFGLTYSIYMNTYIRVFTPVRQSRCCFGAAHRVNVKVPDVYTISIQYNEHNHRFCERRTRGSKEELVA